jgi:predicted HicB family RNase H-like nuclease
MAPPLKKKRLPGEPYQFLVRLPPLLHARLKTKATREGQPMNRVIVDELTAFPNLEALAELAKKRLAR